MSECLTLIRVEPRLIIVPWQTSQGFFILGEIMKELKPDAIERTAIMAEVKFMQENRINFSKQADEVIEKIKRGEKSTDSDYFILLHTDQKKIDEAIELDAIKNRIAKGQIQHKDIDFLVDLLGNTKEFDKALRKAFYRRADQMNLHYAQTHPDEFTDEEIQEKAEKLQAHQSLKEILEENLNI